MRIIRLIDSIASICLQIPPHISVKEKRRFYTPPSQNSCSYAEKSGNKKSRANQSTQPMLYLTDLYDSGNTTAYAVISFMITTSRTYVFDVRFARTM